ncbi:hypothetical protein CPC08DRAFT_652922 [Agrocybe pediades]|nr:hypothetical protein CPC08DRAFT_652922 [Agrocybe pediades]
MARATRSTTADLKRKRSTDHLDPPNDDELAPSKLPRTDDHVSSVDASPLLLVLDREDPQGLLDRVFSDQSASLRTLLSSPSPVQNIKRAISLLKPISSVPRAKLTPTAAQQLAFCNLAHSLLEQLVPLSDLSNSTELPTSEGSPPRPQLSYALVQHLPSGDYWTSVAHTSSPPKDLHTANAELVAILPAPSSSSTDASIPTLSAYCAKPSSQKKHANLPHRKVTTGVFLDYGMHSSFAPAFDHDGEVIGKNQLSEVLWYKEEKKRLHDNIRRERLEGSGSIIEISTEPDVQSPMDSSPQEAEQDLELEALLPPEDVASIKAALNNLELEKSVQSLLERNQRALERLEELQVQRLTKHPTSHAEEDSEEWETAQAILDSLSLLASLRPRSSSKDVPAIVPPPSVLHKLHRTLFIEPSPGWYGTLPSSRANALRDDSTVRVRAGAATPAPMPTTASPAPAPAANTFTTYPYTYAPQQGYRPQQAPTYTPYKPGQTTNFYQAYQQQTYYAPTTYATGATNQQPYGTVGQQQYAGGYNGSWYGQYSTVQSGSGSGRGTPQPTTATAPAPNLAPTYGSFFSATGAAASPSAAGSRTPAIANTVVPNASGHGQTTGVTPTLPVHVRSTAPVTTNGSVSQTTR